MVNIFTVIGNLLGIGKSFLDNRMKRKELEAVQRHEIIKAETTAVVDRITSNTKADNDIDLGTARNKKYTLKDEVITYLFLVPIFIASFTPFVIAYQNNEWHNMNVFIRDSYQSLDQLPEWYKYVLGMVVIDVLGFRSFMRQIVSKWINKGSKK